MANFSRTVPHIMVYYNAASTPNAGTISPFDTNLGGTFITRSSHNLVWTTTLGRFNVREKGLYYINYSLNIQQSLSGLITTFTLRQNASTVWAATNDVYLVANQTTNVTVNAVLDMAHADYVDLILNGVSTATISFEGGSTFTMYKIG